jgi:WD40 repeat protein
MSLAYSADGKLLATGGSSDYSVRLYDTATRKAILSYVPHKAWVTGLAFSPDGKRLASASDEIVVCDTATGKVLRTLNGGRSIAFSPDGKQLLGLGYHQGLATVVTIWDVETGKVVRQWEGSYSFVGFSKDGKRVVAVHSRLPQLSGAGHVRIWDAESGKELLTVTGGRPSVSRAALSPDGKYLAWSGHDDLLSIYDAATGKRLATVKDGRRMPYHVAYSPDGKRIVTSDLRGMVTVLDVKKLLKGE